MSRGARRLGFGVSGPHGSLLIPSSRTEFMVRKAYELGVRYFDTAPSYGGGEAEKRLGRALSRLPRPDCIVSTKVGIYSKLGGRRVRDFSPDTIHRSIEASLKRLRIQKLDCLYLHGPAPVELTDALFRAVENEQYNGRVGILGVAGRGAEMDAALETGLFKSFMTPVHQGLDLEQIARLKRIKDSSAELIAIESLAGSLPNSISVSSTGAVWRTARKLAGRINKVPKSSLSPAEAMRWAITDGGAKRVMCTTSRVRHLAENIQAVGSAPQPT